jgi:electron transport complex protein RnfA
LITTNGAILGLALFGSMREYNLIRNFIFGLGAGAGFTLALNIIAGILAFAFMGFAGMI